MAAYSLTRKAAADLDGIYEYSILNFGAKQAQDYLLGLQGRFQVLAENSMLGRSAAEVEPDLRRFNHRSHVVFYRAQDQGVLIVRVLHESQDFERHL